MLWNEYSYDVADARVPKKDLRENKLALYDCVFVRVTENRAHFAKDSISVCDSIGQQVNTTSLRSYLGLEGCAGVGEGMGISVCGDGVMGAELLELPIPEELRFCR